MKEAGNLLMVTNMKVSFNTKEDSGSFEVFMHGKENFIAMERVWFTGFWKDNDLESVDDWDVGDI